MRGLFDLEELELKPRNRSVLLAIIKYHQNGVSRISCRKLAKRCRIGKDTASTAIRELELENLIHVERKKRVVTRVKLSDFLVSMLSNNFSSLRQNCLNFRTSIITITDSSKYSTKQVEAEPASALPELQLLFLKYGPEEFWNRVPVLTDKERETCEILLRQYGEEYWTRVFSGIKYDPWLMGKAINAEKGYSTSYTFHFRTLLTNPKSRAMIIRRALRALESHCSFPQEEQNKNVAKPLVPPDPNQLELPVESTDSLVHIISPIQDNSSRATEPTSAQTSELPVKRPEIRRLIQELYRKLDAPSKSIPGPITRVSSSGGSLSTMQRVAGRWGMGMLL